MRPRSNSLLPLALVAALACASGTAAIPSTPAGAASGTTPGGTPDPRLDSIRSAAQRLLDSMRVASGVPGLTLGIALPDGRTLALASGLSDTAARRPMSPDDRLLQGSVGKTYAAAIAMQLVAEGRLDLDAKVSRYLGDLPWWRRVPNAADVTVRQLLTHTSGIVRYEFDPVATERLRREPMRVWTPEDRLAVLFDKPAPFAAGQGWEYSDTNYIIVGMIIERLTGMEYYEALRRRVLAPLALRNTIPSDRPELVGVANGYAGPKNDLGGYDASVVSRGAGVGAVSRLAINPQFEWTGGGIASTSEDLARWAKLLYEGKVVDTALVRQMIAAAVPAKLGPGVKYGFGVIVRPTPLGEAWGHSGFFPGYATEMMYLPASRVALAVQANRTDPYPRALGRFLVDAARVVVAVGEGR